MSSASLVLAETPAQTVSFSFDSADTGSWGRITPISHSFSSGKPQPEHVEEQTPLRGAASVPIVAEPYVKPLAPLQLAGNMPVGLQPVFFLIFLLGAVALGVLFSRRSFALVLIAATFMLVLTFTVSAGCCVNPIDSGPLSGSVCLDQVSLDECCGTDVSAVGYTDCQTTFVDGATDCFDPSYQIPDCLNQFGCCVTSNLGCSDVNYQAECEDKSNFFLGSSCSDSNFDQICKDTCCVWTDNSDKICDIVPVTACNGESTPSGVPDGYTFASKDNSITDQVQCRSESVCSSIDNRPSNVSGYVTDSISGSPVQDALVSNGVSSSRTDNTGHYEIIDSYSGGIYLEVSKTGYDTLIYSFNLPPNSEMEKNFTLTYNGNGTVNGKVYLGVGSPHPAAVGASVILTGEDGWNYQTSFVGVGSNGFYEFLNVPSGHSYSVTAQLPADQHYSPASSNVFSLSPAEEKVRDLTLDYNGNFYSIDGRVLDGSGSPYTVKSVEVSLTKDSGGSWTVSSDSLAHYSFGGLTPGSYEVRVSPSSLDSNQASSINSTTIIDSSVSGLSITISSAGGSGLQTCTDLSGTLAGVPIQGRGCCSSTSCPSGYNLGASSDCNGAQVCCAEVCNSDLTDSDGDGTPDIAEPLCMWEPQISSDSARDSYETDCNDGIDNDCDSTGPGEPGSGYDTNNEDSLDSDCKICPSDPCDYTYSDLSTGRICNETSSQAISSKQWDSFDLSIPSDNDTYCSLCSGDVPRCGSPNDCTNNGGACCTFACGGLRLSLYDSACSSGVCCSKETEFETAICVSMNPDDYECVKYPWQCNSGIFAANPNTVCRGDTTYACSSAVDIPYCTLGKRIDDTVNQQLTTYWQPNPLTVDGTPEQVYPTMCACENGVYNVSSDNNYCCLTENGNPYYSTAVCPDVSLVDFEILLYNVTGGCQRSQISCDFFVDPSTNPTVHFEQDGREVLPSVSCSDLLPPHCSGSVPAGTYNVSVTAIGYKTDDGAKNSAFDSAVFDSAVSPMKFNSWLEIGKDCSSTPPLPIEGSDYLVSNILGTTGFSINFKYPCSGTRVKIYRNGSFIKSVPVDENSYCHFTGLTFNCTFDDPALGNAWNTDYNYSATVFRGASKGGEVSQIVNTGNQICEGKTEVTMEFCLNSADISTSIPRTRRFTCDSTNNPVQKEDCEDYFDNGKCVGPDASYRTRCVSSSDCRLLASGGTTGPFSLDMYQSKDACYTDEFGDDSYCYWEYSKTVTDHCIDCDQNSTCYNYTSELSCIDDRCNATGVNAFHEGETLPSGNCNWLSTSPEIGKGICYRENYPYSDFCYLCNQTSDIFKNPNCSQSVCSDLGSCFSVANGASCGSCNDKEHPIDCSVYTEEESCIGSGSSKSSFSFDTCTGETVFSNDSCGVGVCNWDASTGKCFKDLNANGISDCAIHTGDLGIGGSTPSGNCMLDNTPPVSKLTHAPDFISSVSSTFNFTVSDDYNRSGAFMSNLSWTLCSTYGCHVGSRCLTYGCDCVSDFKSARIVQEPAPDYYINLPEDWSSDLTNFPQGWVNLVFYGVDMWGYKEKKQTYPVFVDTIPPNITNFAYETINRSDNPMTSNLNVTFETSEPTKCGPTFLKYGSFTDMPTALDDVLSTYHEGLWTGLTGDEGLYDGSYQLHINCSDELGNINETVEFIQIARLGEIYDRIPDPVLSPDESDRLNNIYTSNTISFQGKTPFAMGTSVSCSLYSNTSAAEVYQLFGDSGSGSGAVSSTLSSISSYKETDMDAEVQYDDTVLHTKDYTVQSDGNYHFTMVCDNSSSIVAADMFFSVDREGPQVKLLYFNSGLNQFLPYDDSIYLKRGEFKFDFKDPEYLKNGGLPGAAGFGAINYSDSLVQDCSPTTEYTLDSPFTITEEGHRVSWIAFDAKENTMSPSCQSVKINIDNEAPIINITNPDKNYVTGNSQISVNGTWYDRSGLFSVKFIRQNTAGQDVLISGGFIETSPPTFTSGSANSPGTLTLVEGANNIRARAYDNAFNDAEDEITIYYDTVPPELGRFTANSGVNDVEVEYGENISLDMMVDDVEYTKNYEQHNILAFTFSKDQTPISGYNPYTIHLGVNNTTAQYNITPVMLSNGNYDLMPGNYSVSLNYYDSIGNSPVSPAVINLTIADTVSPRLNITINDTDEDYPSFIIDTGKTYHLEIESSEALLNDNLVLAYSWANSPWCPNNKYYVNNITMINPTHYIGKIYIPSEEDDTCVLDVDDGLITFVPENVFDRNNNSLPSQNTVTAVDYKLDTLSAGVVQFVYPAMNGETAYVKDDWRGAGYLTGFADDQFSPLRTVTTHMVKRDTPISDAELPQFIAWDDTKSTTSADQETDLQLAAQVQSFNATKGQSWVIINNNQYEVGKGIKFANHDRRTEDFYTITSASDYFSQWNISFTPALEENVSIGTDLTIYDEQEPKGWFDSNFSLIGEGSYYFYSYGTDDHGIVSKVPGWLHTIYDKTSPVVSDFKPANGLITSENSTNISVKLSDSLSGLDVDSVELKILTSEPSQHNGTYSCSDSKVSCLNVDNNPASTGDKELTVVYDGGVLDYSHYDLEVFVKDLSENNVTGYSSFEIRSGYPSNPDMLLDSGYVFNDVGGEEVWFVPKANHFGGNLTFAKDDEVNITGLRMLYQDGAQPTYSRITSNSFNLDFVSDLSELPHWMEVSATKKVNQTDWSTPLPVSIEYITTDLTDPLVNISDMKHKETSSGTSSGTSSFLATNSPTPSLSGSFVDTNIDGSDNTKYAHANSITVSFTDESSGSGQEPASITSSGDGGDWSATFDIPYIYNFEQTLQISIEACDKSGRCTTNDTILLFDTNPPGAPILTSSVSEGWVSAENITYTWTIPDDYSGIEYFLLYKDGSTSPSVTLNGTQTTYTWENVGTGEHSLSIKAVDFAGNPGIINTSNSKIDNTPPSVSQITVTPERTNGAFVVETTITDEGQGQTANVVALVNGSSAYCSGPSRSGDVYVFNCDISSISDFDGLLTVNVTAQDAAVGNSGFGLSQVHADTKVPYITRIENVPATRNENEDITVTTDETASCGWSKSDKAFDSMVVFDETDSTTHKVTVPLDSDGAHTFYIRCRDDLGNTMSVSNTTVITRDQTAPTYSSINFYPIQYYDTSSSVRYTSNSSIFVSGESEQLTQVDVYVNNEKKSSGYIDDRKNPVYYITTTGVELDGQIITEDDVPIGTNAEFKNRMQGLDAIISSNVSGMSSVTLAPGESYNSSMDTLGLYFIEANYSTGSSMGNVGNLYLTVRPISNSFNISTPLPEHLGGLNIVLTDDLGNQNSTQIYDIYYDKDNPEISGIQPGDATSTNDFRSEISFDLADEGSGIDMSSFNMTISVSANNQKYTCNMVSGCDSGTLDISNLPRVVFRGPGGWLNTSVMYYSPVLVSVFAKDKVEHNVSSSWSFTLDSNSPDDPVISVDNQNCDNCLLYISNPNPSIKVEFASTVEVQLAKINNDDVTDLLTSSDDRTWTMDTGQTSGDYTFFITARRTDSSGYVGNSGSWSQEYTIDSSPPSNVQVLSVEPVNSDKLVVGSSPSWSTTDDRVKMRIQWSETSPDTLDITGDVTPVSKQISGSSTEEIVNLTDGDGIKEISVTVTDKSDLFGSTNVNITLDTTGPSPAPSIFVPSWTSTSKEAVTLSGKTSPDTASLKVKVANFTSQTALIDIPLSKISSGEIFIGQYSIFGSTTGDNKLQLDGDVCSQLNTQWIQFDSTYSYSLPRYHVESCEIIFAGARSELTLDRPVQSGQSGSLFAYTTQMPDGYFDVTVSLSPGENVVTPIAYDELNNEADGISVLIVRDDSLTLSLTLTDPSDLVVNQADFGSGSYTITVETNINSDCTIQHPENIIAKEFSAQMSGPNSKVHSYLVDSSSCTENGGNFCMVGGSYDYQRYYDRFTITCTASDVQLDSVSQTPCITIATYTSTQGTEVGTNVCENSGGCGSAFTEPTTACRDCENFDGDQSSCANNNCYWCDSDEKCVDSCTSGSCASEPVDFGNDLVCDASCSSYADSGTCSATGYCSWCSSSDSCVDSCTDCSGEPYDYTGDNVCDLPCSSYTGNQTDCESTNFCLWCPTENTCGTSCTDCNNRPISYGGDRVCDQSCDTFNGDESACSATSYCLWCSSENTCGSSCSSCDETPNNFGDDFTCDPGCSDDSFITEQSCSATNYCMWCPSLKSCSSGCTNCPTYTSSYGDDYTCDQPGSGGNWGFLT